MIVPQGVSEELQHPSAPPRVKDWFQHLPGWVEIRSANIALYQPQKKIGKGEHQAIALALEINADAILSDDKGAALEARRANVMTIQTLSVLEEGAKLGLIDLEDAIERLLKTSFYVVPEIIKALLERHRSFIG